MKRILFAALIVLLPAVAAAQTPEPRLTLRENAERELQQDRLTVSLRVEATGPTASAVQADVNRRMEAALSRARGIAGVRAETTGYWTYEERPANQPRRWRGQAGLNLIGADTGATLALAGALQETGLAMSGMRFDLTPEAARAVQDELTAAALQRVRARADKAADAIGLRVVGIVEMRVGDAGGEGPRPMPRLAMAAQASAPAPVAEPGLAIVRVEVEAAFRLGPK
ncbi:MAG: SIMPL domain-containing protein [Rhodospirillales bacterium]|nr:SIMPL domain-containing protein [Rhodospirillales bacterium]